MTSLMPVRTLFLVAALYDAILGLAFLVAGPAIFDHFRITQPNHWGYVHFPAGLLLIFAMMFLAVAIRPVGNRNLISYGILLKICFAATVFWHWSHGDIPFIWKPFAIIDLVFAVLFVWGDRRIGLGAASSAA
jgi:hypothetical protein